MEVITIGRSLDNDVVLNDSFVGRHHCQILRDDHGVFYIIDFNSKNGTFVNSTRIYGTIQLNPYDVVRVGNTILPWNNYFTNISTYQPHRSYRNKKKSDTASIILGISGTILLIAAAVILIITATNKNIYQDSQIDGISIELNMTLFDVIQKNKSSDIQSYEVPSTDDDDDFAIVYIKGFDYYTINNTVAFTIDEHTQNINAITTNSTNYQTLNGIHVGCTWGDIEQAYSDLEFWLTLYYYDYFAHEFTTAIEAYDPETCTRFVFFEDQLSVLSYKQREELMSCIPETDCWAEIKVSRISESVLRAIRSSLKVSQITVIDCASINKNNDAYLESEDFALGDNEDINVSEYESQNNTSTYNQCFFIKVKEREKFTLPDGSYIWASLSTIGLGDLTFRLQWSGKEPIDVRWMVINPYGLGPTYGVCDVIQSEYGYTISECVSFYWTRYDIECIDLDGIEIIVTK